MPPTPAEQLRSFIAKYSPEVQADARAVLAWMRKRLPGAVELVYDNYNWLVIGFGPNEHATDAVFSIVLAPRWVTLVFIYGADLKDPDKLLRGGGKQVRSIQLRDGVDTLKSSAVRALVDQAVADMDVPFNTKTRRRLVIRAVVARQRPRKPGR